jgi:hypothetical protein
MGSSLLGGLGSILAQANQQANSALGSLTQIGSSKLLWLVAFVVLAPIISIFLRPLLGLVSVITQSITAILGIVIACISSWIVLIFRYLIAIAHAISPTPLLQPYLRVAVVVGALVLFFRYHHLSWYYLAGAAAVLVVLLIFSLGMPHNRRGYNASQLLYSSTGRVVILVSAISLAALCTAGLYLGANSNQPSCVVGGALQQSCIDKIQGHRF